METKNLKSFDIEKAKAGAKVVTRDGRNVRIICWDRVDQYQPIVALVDFGKNGKTVEEIRTYTNRGEYWGTVENSLDLFMAPTVVERWVNVYKDKYGYSYCFYNSEQEALLDVEPKAPLLKNSCNYVATTKITWEE